MAQHAGGITRELMDEPHVAGHRVSVRRIHALVEDRGLDARALAYYHDHPGEMHDVSKRRERRIDASSERGAVTGPEDL